MKALVRNKGETVRETDNIDGIDWNTGLPMTSSEWVGGPYKLIENFVENNDVIIETDEPFAVPESPLEVVEEQSVSGSEEVEDVVLYNFDGKMYTLEELKEKLNKI